jgi:hypothetical protein
LAALGTVGISLGSLIEILDLCTAAFAALLCVVVVIEYGGGYPWGVYLTTATLSLLLAPQKTPAVIYALLGFYPIVKAYVERLPHFAAAGIKCLIFAVLEVGMITFTDLLTGADQVMPPWYYVALYALAFVTLWLYDVLITRLVTRYLFRWRQRIGKFF